MPDRDDNGCVLREQRGAVLVLTLNRPDRLNAWNEELETQYFDALDEADADPSVRAVVVTGAGRGFCAGADMDDLGRVSAGDLDTQEIVTRVRPKHHPAFFRKPLVAAINGAAAGLGLVEALYCDVRFGVPSAKLTTSFAKRGLVAEYGSAWLLPRIVGVSRALNLLMSSRVVQGEEALRIGLIDFLVEPERLLDEAIAYAESLATWSSPTSMAVIKSQVLRGLEGSFEESTRAAEAAMLASFDSVDMEEGVASYLEKRPPRFAPLATS